MPLRGQAALTTSVTSLLARWTPYLETELSTLPGLVRSGEVCVDVGAAAGLYSLALSHLAGSAGQVHSVEPVPFSHPVWSRVLGAWQCQNVHRHAVALGPERGRAAMRVPYTRYGRPDTSRSFLDWKTRGVGSNAEFSYHADIIVDVTTLDALCADVGLTRLDFVKIDVEGGELHVLHGGEQVIGAFRPTVLIEIEARHTTRYGYCPDDVVDWFTARGYAMYTWRHGWQPADRVCVHANNHLFRPADPGNTPARSAGRPGVGAPAGT